MFALDLFNTDHERRLAEGAVDQLEQRRIDDLAGKMDDLVARAKKATTPEVKQALMKEFQKCKAERDSYYKIRNETMGYGGLVGEEAHEFKGAHGKLDVTRTPGKTVVTRKEYPDSDEMRADKFPNRKLKGQGSGTAVKSGSGTSSSQGSMRKFARLDHDGNDEANYEVDESGIPGNIPTEKIPGKEDLLKGKGRSYYESVEDGNPSKKVFKDKAGKPVGEIGIDPESSPGNGEWYVYHYGTGYSVVGFDSAAEAKRELMYVHKHPEAVEGHESTFDEADQKKNSEAVEETSTDYSRRRARDRDPDAPRPLNKAGMPTKPRQPKSSDYANRRAREKELDEFAPGGGKENSDDLTDEAYKDGQRLGRSLVDGATRSQGFEASRYTDKYLVPFSYGWNSGRKQKIKQAQGDGVELVMKKDGSLVRAGQINEFAPSNGGEPEQEQPSQVALAIERLVNKGAQVQVQLSGVRGRVAWVDVKPDGTTEIRVQFRNLDKKPTHGNTLSLELDSNDDNTLKLDMSTPKQYVLTGEYKRKNPMRHIGLDEFAPGGTMKPPAPPTAKKRDPFEDDDRSEIVKTVKRLLDAGNKVDSMIAGARGHITHVAPDLAGFGMKKLNKPYAGGGLFRPMSSDEDDQIFLKMVKPGYYQLWNKELVDEADGSKKPKRTHTNDCSYSYGHDCDCKGQLSHANDCHYRYGHDCDCGLDDLKSRRSNLELDETDETSWTANSSKFRQEENMSWTVQVTLEPRDDINKGRGTQQKTMTVSAMSRDMAVEKIRKYFMKNGWAVTDIKFTGDLDEQGVAEGATVSYVVTYFDTKTGDRGESTVSALTGEDARDKIVQLMHERGYDVTVTGVAVDDVEGWEDDYHDEYYTDLKEGFQDFNKVEPYAVCLAGKPVKQFDYYEDARRFHDNWKKKLYAQGDKAKADKITLNPVMKEAIVASGPSRPLDDRAVRKLVWDTMKINADSGEQAIQRALSVLAKKPQSRMVQDLQDKFQSLANRLEQGVAEGSVTKKPQPYNDPNWTKKLSKDQLDKLAGPRYPKDKKIKKTGIAEDQDTSAVESAIIRRIMVAHTDLLMKFGPEKVMQAAEEVAYDVGDVDEIGTSDVSAYVAQVKQILGADQLDEKWSQKYKSSINCANPKGFSQKAHCDSKKK